MFFSNCIEFAKTSQWYLLQRQLEETCSEAEISDSFGMLPLHWACTDKGVPLSLINQLILAYPAGVKMGNKNGLLPLHISIKAQTTPEVVDALVQAYPEALLQNTPTGETPLQLAMQLVSKEETINVLRSNEKKLQSNASEKHSLNAPIQISKTESTTEKPIQEVYTATTPPKWQCDKKCSVCSSKFNYLRLRHHCRNCGSSVCGSHSRNKVILPMYGFSKPERICICCETRSESLNTTKSIVFPEDNGKLNNVENILLQFNDDGVKKLATLLSNATVIDNNEWIAIQAHIVYLEQQLDYMLKFTRESDIMYREMHEKLDFDERYKLQTFSKHVSSIKEETISNRRNSSIAT